MADYLSCSRNNALAIPDMSSSETWDKVVSVLMSKIQFKVGKAICQEFEEATKIAMHVKAAFSGISLLSAAAGVSPLPDVANSPILMEISNTQPSNTMRGKQLLKDIRNNACVTCHKEVCRPWKHRKNGNAAEVSVANNDSALTS